MANGERKRIDQVEEGDYVLATDPETGETGAREVIATLPHTDQLLALKTSSGDIITTEDHGFWNVTDGEWQESQHLDEGDELLTADGDEVTVEGLDWTTVHTDDAYDLTIADLHTYYVGAGDESVLVHNAPWCGNLPRLDGSGKVHWYERNIPDYVPENWTRADMTQIADDLRVSIATRKAMNAQRGIDYGHAKMLADEERLLRQLEKKLSGS